MNGVVISRHLWVLHACLFVVMIGVGITMPVLPFYVARLALAEGVSRQSIVMHVGLLTGVYAVGQLIFAPLWGRLSDRIGRRSLILIGITGYVAAQVLFGLATSLWLLYAARVLGGVLSSATLPVSAAYVADTARYGHLLIDSFSVPFFVAAFLGLLTLGAAIRWLPESHPVAAPRTAGKQPKMEWRKPARALGPLLALAIVAQFGLAIFESTFALYAQSKFAYGPRQVGTVFVVCGLAMTVVQVGAVSILAGRVRELQQIGTGLALMGVSLVLLTFARSTVLVLAVVGLLALGSALISRNVYALISRRSDNRTVGASLGAQNAVNGVGQASGPLLGSAMFIWHMNAPYLLTGALLITAAVVISWRATKIAHT